MSKLLLLPLFRLMALMLWATAAAAGGAPDAGPVDINHADAIELAARLNGVGPSRAEAIIHYRETQGPLRSPRRAGPREGHRPKTLEKNRQRIRIGPPADTAQP